MKVRTSLRNATSSGEKSRFMVNLPGGYAYLFELIIAASAPEKQVNANVNVSLSQMPSRHLQLAVGSPKNGAQAVRNRPIAAADPMPPPVLN